MDKILIVYNCCQISGKDNSDYYIKRIKEIFNQTIDKFDIVISGCCLENNVKNKLQKEFGNKILYSWINEKHPVELTFNFSVNKTVENRGKYKGYLYHSSSSSLNKNERLIETMIPLLDSEKYGMISPQPSQDTEYYAGLKVGRFRNDDEFARSILFKNGDYIIPPGRGFGCHINLVSEKLREFYGKCFPDIFASHCAISIFTFLCAALNTQWILLEKFIVNEDKNIDGSSSGFSTLNWVRQGKQTYDHPYIIPSIIQRLCTKEALSLGMGYEESRNIMLHDKDLFDENYHAKKDQLKFWIKNNCFLQDNELDYNNIEHEFIS